MSVYHPVGQDSYDQTYERPQLYAHDPRHQHPEQFNNQSVVARPLRVLTVLVEAVLAHLFAEATNVSSDEVLPHWVLVLVVIIVAVGGRGIPPRPWQLWILQVLPVTVVQHLHD